MPRMWLGGWVHRFIHQVLYQCVVPFPERQNDRPTKHVLERESIQQDSLRHWNNPS